jgi:hypothetical protein
MATTFQGGPGKAPAQRAGPPVARIVPTVTRQAAGAARIEAVSALIDGRRRAGADPRAMLALQRQAGNAAVGALMTAKLKSPGEHAVSEMDAALKEIRKSDPAVGTIEKGLGAASTTGLRTRGPQQRSASKPAVAVAQRSCRTSSRLSSPIPTIPGAHEPSAVTTGPVAAEFASNVSVQRGLWGRIVGGVSSLAGGIRDRVLGTLSGFARRMPGYELLSVILGRDVVSAQPVTRNAAAIIGGVLALIPGGAQMRENLQQAGAIERAGAWFDAEIPKLGLSWDAVRGLFRRAWDALGASDLLSPTGAWQKIAGIFGPPLARLRDFAVAAGSKVLEFIFEGVLSMAGSLGGQVMAIVRRAGGVIQQIFRDPVGFAGNLIAALRGGLSEFMTHIGSHLRNGLVGWLTGSLGGIIRLPARLDLRGILGMALDFLGITWQRVRGKLVTLIGERALGFLERGAGIVHDLVERGLGAITDRIAQFTSGIVETVLGGIREWVQNSVVGAAITRLLSMFNPAGAIIQAILAVYNTVKFFIERAQQLGALASSIFDSVAAIASGGVGGAIRLVEQAFGRAVPVVLGFLARLMGLGDIAGPVRNVMARVHTVIDSAIDRVVGWIARLAPRGRLLPRGDRPPSDQGSIRPQSLDAAVVAGQNILGRRGATPDSVAAGLEQLRREHGLRVAVLRPGAHSGTFHIHVQRAEADTADIPLVVDLSAAGVSSRASAAVGGQLSLDMILNRIYSVSSAIRWTTVGPPLARAGDESLLHALSLYGLNGYIRYHVRGPGTGQEGYPIFAAPTSANQFANHNIEGPMRRWFASGLPVRFRASYTTFGPTEMRPFVEGMLGSGNRAVLSRLAIDQGRIEVFLKTIDYEIEVTRGSWIETYGARIQVGTPPSGTMASARGAIMTGRRPAR